MTEYKPAFLLLRDVLAYTGLSRSFLYACMDAGTFPRQYKLGRRKVGWKTSEVDEWVESREQVSE